MKKFWILLLLIISSLDFIIAQKNDSLAISENYLFYSPDDNDFGVLVFLGDNYKLLMGKKEEMILLDKENIHIDTFNLKDNKITGDLYSLMKFPENCFSFSTQKDYLYFKIENNSIKLKKRKSMREIRKIHGDHSFANLLPNGFIVYSTETTKSHYKQKYSLYNLDGDMLKSFEINGTKQANQNYYYLQFYPENLFFVNNKIYFANIFDHEMYTIDLKTLSLSQKRFCNDKSDSKIQDLYVDIYSEKFYFLEFDYSKKRPSQDIKIFSANANLDFTVANSFTYPSHLLRCGIYQNKLILTGKFENDYSFYLVPIPEIHTL
jgi:hypothetical protein